MASKGKAEFLIWHEKNKDKEFDFQKEMLEYCRSDVDIMRRICSMFREEMIKISGVDPFCYITIASCCMAVYRSRHLQANTIAMVPVNGYINNTNYSSDAIRW
nr:uncharacterized protein LOC122268626 [Parasteatoda tepidariorum]